jgi:flagellar protein FliS
MLYRGAATAVANARVHLRDRDITARSRQITKAIEIINELMLSLDRQQGGELAANLAELYDYMQRRLQEANFHQIEEPLVEIERLLRTLLEAWEQCVPPANARPAHPPNTPAAGTNAHLPPPPPPTGAEEFPSYGPRRIVHHG